MKAYPHSEEIYSKSRLCYFLLTLLVTVTVLVTVCKTFSRIELENRHWQFTYCILTLDPLAEEHPAI